MGKRQLMQVEKEIQKVKETMNSRMSGWEEVLGFQE
jgi:hypothetical protein